jgi:hypothetical protein
MLYCTVGTLVSVSVNTVLAVNGTLPLYYGTPELMGTATYTYQVLLGVKDFTGHPNPSRPELVQHKTMGLIAHRVSAKRVPVPVVLGLR